MTVSLNGYTAGYATLEAAEGLEPGVVAMSGDHQVDAPAAGTVSYQDLCKLWGMFDEYEMNVLLVSPEVGNQILALPELRTAGDGNRFGDPSSFVTPFGAELIKCSAVPAGTIVALDRGCALEMVTAGGVSVEYDKAIDCQTERVGITSITGFAKLYPDAVKVMTLKA